MSTRKVDRKNTRQYKSASKPRLIALEPRMLFDGAAVATVVDAAQDTQNALTNKAVPTVDSGITSAAQTATAADTPIAIDPNQIEAVTSLTGMGDGALALAQPAGDRNELIVVDGSLENLQSLLDNISRIAPDKTLLVLDPSLNQEGQLSTYLQERSAQFDAIHILSHGGPGWISLNEQVLSLDTLEQNATLWNSVKTGLTETGDLLLYGCSVAADENGQTQINALAALTGADIAASTDVTGVDGDWVLEARAGDLETAALAPIDWQGNLYTWVVPTSSPSGVTNRLNTTYGVFEGAWWGDPANAPTYHASYDDNGAKADLVLGNNFGGSGAGFQIVQVGSASAQRLTNVQALTYDQAVANNEYFASTAFVQSSYDIALRALKFNQVSANASTARMAVALYDVAAGTLTRIGVGFGDINVAGGATQQFATFRQSATATDLVPMISGRNYEIRFYAWGSSTVYIDNPQLFAMYDSTVSVNNVTVNEGSPTAVFSVTASYGQNLSLALAAGTAAGAGTDYGSATGTNLQYSLNGGTTWINYTGAFNNNLTGAGTTSGLLVRTPITNDTTQDNGETFTLTATPTGGIAAVGTGTILDDGTGTIFTATGAIDNTTPKNDDRPATTVLVNSLVVNEGSPTAVFTVTATVGQNLSLAMANGTATGSGTDYGAGMEYSLNGGATWITYTGAFNNALTGSGTTTGLLVRTPITNDATPDNGETFTLTATPTGGTAVTGTATIKDDGTGTIFTSTGAVDNTAVKNNDITVNNLVVNEGSPTAVFTVNATLGQNLSLALANVTATGNGTDFGAGMEYSLDGGSTWIAYTGAFNNNLTGNGTTTGLLVRTPITNDSTPDNGETFTLTVTPTGGTAVVGTGTIKDDGTGTIFAATGAIDNAAVKNNDITVNNLVVNEGSPTAVFTVTATVGQNLSLALANGTAIGSGTDYGTGMEYSLNGGATWITYTGAFNNNLTGNGTTTGLLVRTPITNDTTPDNGETFTLTATPTGGTAVTGTATIKDDGTGTIFTSTGTIDNTAVKNNDITVNSITVNEASPTAVFNVTATLGQNLSLALANGTATGNGTDFGAGMEYSLDGGSTWIAYTGAFNNNLTGSGTTTGLLVRTPIINDTAYEMSETFTLTATATGGTGATGTATIKDDGSGTIFTATGAVDNTTPKNDDRPTNTVFIDNLVVNEGSPTAVFVVSAAVGQELTLALANGTATGSAADYGSGIATNLEYSLNGGATWIAYTGAFNNALTGAGVTTGLLVRTPITNDTTPDNGETFTLTATPTGGTAVTGTATIKDDGTGTIFTSTGAIDNAAVKNNDITVNNLVVNEGSPTAVFTVTATVGQNLSLALANGTATGNGTDYGAGLQYSLDGGSTWINYTSPFNNDLTGNGTATGLLVRTPITNDTTPDNGETFTLVVTPTGGTSVIGTATIKDDGTGTIFTSTGTEDNSAVKNNDIKVNNLVINEGSPTAVFTVTATVGQNLSLALANGTAIGSGTDYGTGMEYSLNGGATWIAYTGPFNNNLSDSAVATGLLVRTPITNDTTPDNGETFTLTATPTGGTAVTGTATIKDDGTGTIFTSTGAIDNAAVKNNDITVNNLVVNEGSPTAVFTVTATVGQNLSLALANGTATGNGTDYGAGLQYSLDGGSTWINYTSPFNNDLTGNGTATGLLVRTPITNDTTPDNGETFTLVVTPTGGTSVIGTATIKDDGTGTIFTSTGTEDNSAVKNNDIKVNNLVINEGSPTAVFTVTATVGQNLSLALANGTAIGSGTDYGTGMEYSLNGGATWIAYTGPFNNNLSDSAVATGLLVRTPITNDTTPDNGETFTLTATPTGGTAVTGTATIKDDGTGTIFTSTGAIDNAAVKNNDITVNNLVVNEGSPTAVFTVTATVGQNLSLALANGTATGNGTDYGAGLQYSLDGGSTWINYTSPFNNDLTGNGTATGLLVRTPIINDTPYEMSETFTLTVTPTGGTSVTGTATIKDDGSGTIFTSTGAIDNAAVKDDDRPVNPAFVNNIRVNEGSSFVVFNVTGVRSAQITLELAAGTATSNVDYTNSLEYWNGTGWTAYSLSAPPSLDNTDGALQVRVPILQDTILDGGENFQLTVRYTGVKDPAITNLIPDTTRSFIGNAIIVDDTTGQMWNSAGIPITPASAAVLDIVANPNLVIADDDRPLMVSDVTVNEASQYAVFTVTGAADQYVKLSLASGTATSADYDPALEYFNGADWVSYIPGSYVRMPAGGTTLMVRVAIVDDAPYEGAETFTLTASNVGGGSDSGTGTIKDDGTGLLLNASGNPITPVTAGVIDLITYPDAVIANDDRTLEVNSVTVNEASPYAVFTVTGAANQYVMLLMEEGTATDADYGPALEYYDGSSWVSYIPGSFVQIPATGTTLLVRTPITNDSPFEGSETFSLSAFNASRAGATGTGTIKDDGTGSLFSGVNTTGTPESPRRNGLPARLNDDRAAPGLGSNLPPPAPPVPEVADVTVNEASPYAVFTVTGAAGQSVKLALADGTATGADYGSALEYYDGTAWVPYTANSFVQIPATGTTLLVRTPITNDAPFEGSETFTLSVFNTAGIGDDGTGTIKDDGTGTIFTATGAIDNDAIKDDDRLVTVNDVTVNEASPYAVFTVTGAAGQSVKLALADGTATGADYGSALEYYDGTAWVPYTANSFVQIPATGTTLLVRTPITNDAPFEGSETFTLSVFNTAGIGDDGTGTIKDDGTGTIFTATGAIDNDAIKDDDRLVTVNDVTVNEASPYAVFTVTGAAGQSVKLALADGTATGADYGSALEYYDGTAWVPYTANSFVQIPATGTTLLVRTPITNDAPFEGSETFTLSVFNTAGIGDDGTGTIKDDGTGSLFSGVNTTGNEEAPGINGLPAGLNDDRVPPVRVIGQNLFSPKPIEYPPLLMGGYEFNTVVLNFNGSHGGINQFGLPHVDTTGSRQSLGYSNATPYASYDRVSDAVENAQRTIRTDLALTPADDIGLRNPLLPPDAKVDANGKTTYLLPSGTFVGGKGEIKLTAFTKDGKPLPDWIKFSPVDGKFDIAMPSGVKESIELEIIATDANGDQARTKINIKPAPIVRVESLDEKRPEKIVDKADDKKVNSSFGSKDSFTNQIKEALTRNWK